MDSRRTVLDVVDGVLGEIERLRLGTPVLALRERPAGEPPAWSLRGVGVLRLPILPEVIGRTVDALLALPARPAAKGSSER